MSQSLDLMILKVFPNLNVSLWFCKHLFIHLFSFSYWSVQMDFKTHLREAQALLLQKLSTRIFWYLFSHVAFLVLTFSVFSFSAELLLLLRVLLHWLPGKFRLVSARRPASIWVRGRLKPLIPLLVPGMHCQPVSEYMIGEPCGSDPFSQPSRFLPFSKINWCVSLISSREMTPSRGRISIQPLFLKELPKSCFSRSDLDTVFLFTQMSHR